MYTVEIIYSNPVIHETTLTQKQQAKKKYIIKYND